MSAFRRRYLLLTPVLLHLAACLGPFDEPTFVLPQGTQVWTNGLTEVREEELSAALAYFQDRAAERVPRAKLETMLEQALVEFVGEPIEDKGALYAGQQIGYYAIVWWRGGIAESALFHELVHMVRTAALGLPPDYAHADTDWWSFESEARQGFRASTRLGD